jgi:dTMP kinase
VTALPIPLATGKRPQSGLLVTFDGLDGSGKTTSARRLCRHLRKQGRTVRVFKLPSNEAKRLALFRDYNLDPLSAEADGRVDIFAMFLALAGDRLNTVTTTIQPLLDRGCVVIVDRYLYSVLGEVLVSSDRMTTDAWRVVAEVVARFPTPHAAFFTRVGLPEARRRIHAREKERDDVVDQVLFSRRIETFEMLRTHFDGLLLDTELDQNTCFKRILTGVGEA